MSLKKVIIFSLLVQSLWRLCELVTQRWWIKLLQEKKSIFHEKTFFFGTESLIYFSMKKCFLGEFFSSMQTFSFSPEFLFFFLLEEIC